LYHWNLFEGNFGLERETLRIHENGMLAQTAHPFSDKHLTRDFCENQLEIVTPVCKSIEEMLAALRKLDTKARRILARQQETLWLYSNPPHIETADEIPIARFEQENIEKFTYRKHLAQRYGKRLMLYSGIHFNFSFSEHFLTALYETRKEKKPFASFKNDVYLQLLKQASRYSWLLVFLTAASPVYDKSLDGDYNLGTAFDGYASMRNGNRGYWNTFLPTLDYSSLTAYTDSVQHYVEDGMLFSAGELYLPVRIKPKGENSLGNLRRNGADHIELRMFDLNPLEPLGIHKTDLEFAYLLLVYLTSLEDFTFTAELQRRAIAHHKLAARYKTSHVKIDGVSIGKAAEQVLDKMMAFFGNNNRTKAILLYERRKISSGGICKQIKNTITDHYQRDILKAIPHKDPASDAQSDFLSDETKSGMHTLCMHEHFCEI
jgi:glutamate--cysteine ligase